MLWVFSLLCKIVAQIYDIVLLNANVQTKWHLTQYSRCQGRGSDFNLVWGENSLRPSVQPWYFAYLQMICILLILCLARKQVQKLAIY